MIKKDLRKIAEKAGFSGSRLGEVEIIISEMTSNLVKHAFGEGEILVKTITEGEKTGLEFICIDNGPGMADPQRMLQDGTSTVGTLGQGLGAIARLSDDFEIFSRQALGTILLSRIFIERNNNEILAPKLSKNNLELRTLMVSKPGETCCGDGWAFSRKFGIPTLLAVDGLGHGPEANNAAREAINYFLNTNERIPSVLLTSIHNHIRKTRGVVGAAISYDEKKKTLNYCGIGNISTRIFTHDAVKSFFSYNGIIGMNKPSSIHTQEFECEAPVMVVITSDGIKSRWDLNKYPNIIKHEPSIIAALVYRDFARRTDDTLVTVLKTPK